MSIMNRIMSLIKFARISGTTKDEGNYPIQQVSYMGRTANIYMVLPYGMAANIPQDALVVMFDMMAQEENRAGIPSTPKLRLKKLKTGEVAYGHPLKKTWVKFDEDGNIVIFNEDDEDFDVNVTAKNINITADETTITGNVTIDGDLEVTGNTDLGGTGGPAIARVGDSVVAGVITTGSGVSNSN